MFDNFFLNRNPEELTIGRDFVGTRAASWSHRPVKVMAAMAKVRAFQDTEVRFATPCSGFPQHLHSVASGSVIYPLPLVISDIKLNPEHEDGFGTLTEEVALLCG